MHCPFCNTADTRVVDSRLVGDGDQVRRRRECAECKDRFTTYETIELNMPRLVKHDGSRATFDERKLRSGISRALEKRPVGSEDLEKAISRIKRQLMARGEREVPTDIVGQLVMEELRALDQVAYVRFASVYRSFQDVQEFREEIERLESLLPPETERHQLSLIPEK